MNLLFSHMGHQISWIKATVNIFFKKNLLILPQHFLKIHKLLDILGGKSGLMIAVGTWEGGGGGRGGRKRKISRG